MTACTFTGPLAADAQARSTRTGEHLLLVTVEVPAGKRGAVVMVKATKLYGSGTSAAMACRNRAHHLRRGVRVTLSGQRLSWYRGAAEIDGLDRLDAPDLTFINRAGGDEQ